MPNYRVTKEEIDAVLPQTQCGECGYKGCMPYAEALVNQDEAINLCPPGGLKTMLQLSQLLEIDAEPYLEDMKKKQRQPQQAYIRELECIGCTKCIQACPVDAIVGAAKLMHTIIADECTGCGLCVPACPVDCINMIDLTENNYDRSKAKQRYLHKQSRLNKMNHANDLAKQRVELFQAEENQELAKAKRDYIKNAVARASMKRTSHDNSE